MWQQVENAIALTSDYTPGLPSAGHDISYMNRQLKLSMVTSTMKQGQAMSPNQKGFILKTVNSCGCLLLLSRETTPYYCLLTDHYQIRELNPCSNDHLSMKTFIHLRQNQMKNLPIEMKAHLRSFVACFKSKNNGCAFFVERWFMLHLTLTFTI